MSAFWGAALFLVTGLIFLLPLLPAIIELRRRQDIAPLKIEQGHEGNARYFADRFRDFIRDAIANEHSRQQLLMLDTGEPTALGEAFTEGAIERVVVCNTDLQIGPDSAFDREVYGATSIVGGSRSCYRAVLAEDDLSLAEDSTVLRWAHAKRITVGAGTALLGRVTAMEFIHIRGPARFTRLNAPIIRFGATSGGCAPVMPRARKFSRQVIHGDYRAQSGEHVSDSVVANGCAVISSNAVMEGSIKGGTGVRIESGATLHGSLISGRDAQVAGSCRIAGPVVVEGALLIGRDTVVGSLDSPTTVSATEIRIQAGACIYGSVWAKECGWAED